MTDEPRAAFPPGHYYSPIVDPAAAAPYLERRLADPTCPPGIDLDLDLMTEFWNANIEFIKSCRFPDDPSDDFRYYYKCGFYSYGDAIILRAMINHYRPKNIVEIGSGFSTACMLDTLDELKMNETKITCIEPYPERLKMRLWPQDMARLDLIEHPVQEMEAGRFSRLESGDILFIDSSHVIKTGSDVHYELFHILPSLKPGVIIHFHDIFFPFEYPLKWLHERNFSWNESYGLHAFLMYNQRFKIRFFNDFFRRRCGQHIADTYPVFLKNTGGALWMTKESTGLLAPTE